MLRSKEWQRQFGPVFNMFGWGEEEEVALITHRGRHFFDALSSSE